MVWVAVHRVTTIPQTVSGCSSLLRQQRKGLRGHLGYHHNGESGSLSWYGARPVIGRFQVQYPAGVMGEFSSPDLTFCAYSSSVIHSTPVLLWWHVEDPAHSAKSGGDSCMTRINPWPNKVRVGWLCCVGIVWESVRELSSHATRQGMLFHSHLSLKSGLEWHCCMWADLLFQKQTNKKTAQMSNDSSDLPPKYLHVRKKPPPPPPPPPLLCCTVLQHTAIPKVSVLEPGWSVCLGLQHESL